MSRMPLKWDAVERAGQSGRPPWWRDGAVFERVRIRRILAYLVDLFLLSLVAFAVWFAGGLVVLLSFGLATPLVVGIGALVPLIYHTLFLSMEGNATPGMRALGLRLSTVTGAAPEPQQALLHTVLFYVSVSVTNGLILLVSLFSEQKRCLHDMLCGTVVVDAGVRNGPAA